MAEENKLKIDDVAFKSDIVYRLDDSRKKGEYCDFCIKAGKEDIPVHKNVLAVTSEYFRAMFEHDTTENRQGFVVMGADAEIPVRKCIDFIYSGMATVSSDNVDQVMHYATMFQLEALISGIVDHLNSSLRPSRFFHTKHLAHTYDCEALEAKCDAFAFGHFTAISGCKDFLKLDAEYVLFLIKSKNTKAAEVTKYQAFMRWIRHDYDERKTYFLEMVKGIDLNNIPGSYRRFIVQNEPLVYESAECLKIFMMSFFESVAIHEREIRDGGDSFIMVFDQKSESLRTYDPESRSWDKIHEYPSKNLLYASFTAVTLGEYLYVLTSDEKVYRLLYMNANARWKQLSLMTYNHGKFPNAAVLKGFIYVIGITGKTDACVEKYNPLSDAWQDVPKKNTAHCNTALASAEGKLYSIGGWNGRTDHVRQAGHMYWRHEVYSEVECFDPKNQSWVTVAPMNKARHSAAAACFQRKIFVMGGRNIDGETSASEYYDLSSNTWIEMAPMKIARKSFSALVLKEGIYVVGGEENPKDIERLDLDEGKWEIVGDTAGVSALCGVYLASPL